MRRNGIDEVDGVVVVLLHSGGDRQNVRVEDDVFRREADFVDKQIVGSLADSDFVVFVRGLALFVECHHDGGGAVLANQPGATQELLLRHPSARSN